MTNITKLEEKLIKLDEELHSILEIIREFKKKPVELEKEIAKEKESDEILRKWLESPVIVEKTDALTEHNSVI